MNDSLDDLAAFLMHRTADAGTTEEERYRTFALVSAYQDGDDPPAIKAELAGVFTSGGLKRARELEAFGFLQITLAAAKRSPEPAASLSSPDDQTKEK